MRPRGAGRDRHRQDADRRARDRPPDQERPTHRSGRVLRPDAPLGRGHRRAVPQGGRHRRRVARKEGARVRQGWSHHVRRSRRGEDRGGHGRGDRDSVLQGAGSRRRDRDVPALPHLRLSGAEGSHAGRVDIRTPNAVSKEQDAGRYLGAVHRRVVPRRGNDEARQGPHHRRDRSRTAQRGGAGSIPRDPRCGSSRTGAVCRAATSTPA